VSVPDALRNGLVVDQNLTVAQYNLSTMLKRVRLEIAWADVPGVAMMSLALRFGGVGGGFRVSSGELAHTTAGPIDLMRF